MPAKKESLPVIVDPDDTISFEEFSQAMDLIQWVARAIVTRNANGKKSDKFCRLCSASRLIKEPCRHADIWKLALANK
jgi:hypothetical protein